jgi:hypothetical protein
VSEPDRIERAAELLERLLADAAFRERFRAQPEAACREAGFPDIAEEIAQAGSSLQTLELRESRSSLVGVLMAAALEGMGVLELSHLAGSGLSGEAAAAAHRALTRSGMRAVGAGGGLHAPHVPHAPGLHAPHVPHAPGLHAPHVPHAPQTPPPPPPAGAAPGGPVAGAAAASGPGAPAPADPAAAAGAPGAAPAAPGAPGAAAASAGATAGPGAGGATNEPWPDSAGTPAPPVQGQAGGWPQPGAGSSPPPAPAAAQAGGGPQPGPGSSAQPEALQNAVQTPAGAAAPTIQQVVDDPRITFPPEARANALAGGLDPRFAGLLQTLAGDHRLGVGVAQGQALDIATVDGSPVGPDNPAARELMTELANLDPSLRPPQVGGPWAISAPGFVGGAGYQDHIHLGFDSPSPVGSEPTGTPPPVAGASAPASGARATLQFNVGAQAQPGAPPEPTAAEPRAAAASVQDAPAGGAGSAVDPTPAGGGFDPVAAARDYPGDRASKAALAHWMAEQARRAGLPPELPVMASLVESGLTNVNYGDRDSLGFFQMRTGIWLSQYPDFPHRPELQLKWFIEHALEVKRARVAAGQTAFVDDPSQYGGWIADVERPAEALRGRYQLRLAEARSLLGQPAEPSAAARAAAAAAASPEPSAAAPPSPSASSSPRATLGFAAAPAAPPVGAVAPLPGSQITAPGSPPHALREIFERAAILDHRRLPYLWGGGHQAGVANVATVEPVDCSGAVSAVLGLDARVSGAFEGWGEPGAGRYVTVYANAEHVLMEINGHFFGTSAANPGGGAGWIPRAHVPPSYLARFTVRHPSGL